MPKASAFLISTLSKIPRYKIVKDYGARVIDLPIRVMHVGSYHEYVVYPGQFYRHEIFSDIKRTQRKGVNACINLRVSYDVVTCEYVRIVPKK